LVAWRKGNAFYPINKVTVRRAGYVTSRLGQLSLSSLRSR